MSAESAPPAAAESPVPEVAPPGSLLASRAVFAAAGMMLAVMAAIVVLPGGPVSRVDLDLPGGKHGPHFGLRADWEYGWPVSYATREFSTDWGGVAIGEIITWSTKEVRWLALAVNLALATGFVAGGLWCLHWWRQTRQHFLQLYLSEIFVLTAVVAAIAGWLYWNHQAYQAESALARELQRDRFTEVLWEPGGPTWLRDLVGRERLADFNRVVTVDVQPSELSNLPQLRSLQIVRLNDVIEDAKLKPLEQLPRLEALICSMGVHSLKDDLGNEPPIRLPFLPRLRGLNLHRGNGRLHVDCVTNLPALEVLDLFDADVTEASLDVIGQMKSLRRLRLNTRDVSDAAVARLREALPGCEINE